MKKCNSLYSQEQVKNCKLGYWKDREHYCLCTKHCERCVVANNPGLPVHPELNAEYKRR